MNDSRPHVVIIGGGFGGLCAAKALRKVAVRITLLDRRRAEVPRISFAGTSFTKNAAGLIL